MPATGYKRVNATFQIGNVRAEVYSEGGVSVERWVDGPGWNIALDEERDPDFWAHPDTLAVMRAVNQFRGFSS